MKQESQKAALATGAFLATNVEEISNFTILKTEEVFWGVTLSGYWQNAHQKRNILIAQVWTHLVETVAQPPLGHKTSAVEAKRLSRKRGYYREGKKKYTHKKWKERTA